MHSFNGGGVHSTFYTESDLFLQQFAKLSKLCWRRESLLTKFSIVFRDSECRSGHRQPTYCHITNRLEQLAAG